MSNPFPVSSVAADIFDEILRDSPRLALTAGAAGSSKGVERLNRVSDVELFGAAVEDESMAAATRAGLLLRAERMEESHALSQKIDTPEGSYWHGILHRREPDYSNAKYWLRQVGDHPILEVLASPPPGSPAASVDALAGVVRQGRWDPLRLVDLCSSLPLLAGPRASSTTGSDLRVELERLQDWEIASLLRHCFTQAVASWARARRGR